MTVKEFMERVGITETGRAIAYIKDGLEEINLLSPTNITTTRLDIEENKRYQRSHFHAKILACDSLFF